MRVFLTGGTGFIGTALVRALVRRGDQCVVLSRSVAYRWPGLHVKMVRGDPTAPGPWQEEVDGADAVINLA
ncbi:MAG: NAD-dependent epimerase/dehydratase family protein, partial [Gemmatimonadetes bacterium]|nr:NAD-dependent epimerase/dehydratase family protein [Gemmatimonadota bacterium]